MEDSWDAVQRLASEQEQEVTPTPEPASEPVDPHMPPLEDEEDARFLLPRDPRRIAVERKRGWKFTEKDI